jgi:hypothetical protein
MLEAVERAGVFHGYLEDLVYTSEDIESPQLCAERSAGEGTMGPLA